MTLALPSLNRHDKGVAVHAPSINYIAVILATLSSMIIGSVWYTPKVFGNYWMKLSGVKPSGKA
ncbi:MAG TPA: DUF1761 domain-containing protein, partial [Galbitalea sp.]